MILAGLVSFCLLLIVIAVCLILPFKVIPPRYDFSNEDTYKVRRIKNGWAERKMRVFPYVRTQFGFGFAIWETGAEVFLPYLMLRFMYKSNRFLRLLCRLRFD